MAANLVLFSHQFHQQQLLTQCTARCRRPQGAFITSTAATDTKQLISTSKVAASFLTRCCPLLLLPLPASCAVLGYKMGSGLIKHLEACKAAGTLPDVIVTDGLTSVSWETLLEASGVVLQLP